MIQEPRHIEIQKKLELLSRPKFAAEIETLASQVEAAANYGAADYEAAACCLLGIPGPIDSHEEWVKIFLRETTLEYRLSKQSRVSPVTPQLAALATLDDVRRYGFGSYGPLDQQQAERDVRKHVEALVDRHLQKAYLDTGLARVRPGKATIKVWKVGTPPQIYRPRPLSFTGRIRVSELLDVVAKACPFWARGWRDGVRLISVHIGSGSIEVYGHTPLGRIVDISIPVLAEEIRWADTLQNPTGSQSSSKTGSAAAAPASSSVFALLLMPFLMIGALFGFTIWTVNKNGR